MNVDTLTMDLSTLSDGAVKVYTLGGSLDVATSPSLRAALMEAAEHEGHQIVVDLSRLEFLDSTGLGALIGAQKRASERNGSLRIVVEEGQILRLLRITGLLDVLSVYPTIDDALKDESRFSGL